MPKWSIDQYSEAQQTIEKDIPIKYINYSERKTYLPTYLPTHTLDQMYYCTVLQVK